MPPGFALAGFSACSTLPAEFPCVCFLLITLASPQRAFFYPPRSKWLLFLTPGLFPHPTDQYLKLQYLCIWLCQVLVEACGPLIFVVACKTQPHMGFSSLSRDGTQYWQNRVIATGPPGKPLHYLFIHLICLLPDFLLWNISSIKVGNSFASCHVIFPDPRTALYIQENTIRICSMKEGIKK